MKSARTWIARSVFRERMINCNPSKWPLSPRKNCVIKTRLLRSRNGIPQFSVATETLQTMRCSITPPSPENYVKWDRINSGSYPCPPLLTTAKITPVLARTQTQTPANSSEQISKPHSQGDGIFQRRYFKLYS